MSVHIPRHADFGAFTADELEATVEAATREDPMLAGAIEDSEALQRVLDELVSLRKALKLTQGEVARRMGVRQPSVSQFETESSDPRLSTLQRYARAVESKVVVRVATPAECRSPWRAAYPAAVVYTAPSTVTRNVTDLASCWVAADSNRGAFVLAA